MGRFVGDFRYFINQYIKTMRGWQMFKWIAMKCGPDKAQNQYQER